MVKICSENMKQKNLAYLTFDYKNHSEANKYLK